MAKKVLKQEVGTICQKPNGTYHYRYQINAKRKSISLKTKNQEETSGIPASHGPLSETIG